MSLCRWSESPSGLNLLVLIGIVYKWSHPEANCILSYIGESSWCLENRMKEPNSHISSAIYQHSVYNNHPKASVSHFKIIDEDNKQVAREVREAIHIKS